MTGAFFSSFKFKKVIKYQTKEIVLPAGTPATTKDTNINLDSAFTNCTGVAIHEKTNGGISSYDVGLADDTRMYHHLTDKKDWIAGDGVPLNNRYKNIDIPNEGQVIRVTIKPDAAVVSELRVQIVFRLEKED